MPLPSRLTRAVPVSIAAHLVVLILLLVIPLTANVVLPSLERADAPEFIRAVPIPPAPAAPRVRTHAAQTTAPRGFAPVTAPSRLEAEQPIAPTSAGPDVPGAIPFGGADLGALFDSSVVAPLLEGPPPPPPTPQPAPVRVADLLVAPRKTVDARPVYPEIARTAHIAGTVVLEAVIDPGGRVQQLRVLKSIPLLDQAAIEAVRQWRYSPSRLRGQPVSVLMTVTVTFMLRDEHHPRADVRAGVVYSGIRPESAGGQA